MDRDIETLSWSPPRNWDCGSHSQRSPFSSSWSARSTSTWALARHGWAWPPANAPGLLGQVVGYWAPDLWPAEVLPSYLLAQLEPGGRPSSAAVRWPAADGGYPGRLDPLAQHGACNGHQCGAAFRRLLVRQHRLDRSLRARSGSISSSGWRCWRLSTD